MKDFGCEFLCILRRTFMNKQIAQFYVSVTHIGAKDVLAKEIVKMASGRMLFKERTMLMSRASKGAVAHLNVLRQRVIKRWQQILFILTGCGFQLQPLLLVAVDYRRNARR